MITEQGDAEAQYNLGVMYENGQGVKQDHKEAVKGAWCTSVCTSLFYGVRILKNNRVRAKNALC